jgi:hypothetical protein
MTATLGGRDRVHAPTTAVRGLLLGGPALATGRLDGGGTCHVAAFLSSHYGANTAAEWDCSLDFGALGIELADSDVLVGDVQLPVLVAVRPSPRLGFALRPTGTAIEEERLRRHRWPSSGLRGASTEHWVSRRLRGPTSSCFAEICQSIIVERHPTVASQRIAIRDLTVKQCAKLPTREVVTIVVRARYAPLFKQTETTVVTIRYALRRRVRFTTEGLSARRENKHTEVQRTLYRRTPCVVLTDTRIEQIEYPRGV